jgi:hypothetical protein
MRAYEFITEYHHRNLRNTVSHQAFIAEGKKGGSLIGWIVGAGAAVISAVLAAFEIAELSDGHSPHDDIVHFFDQLTGHADTDQDTRDSTVSQAIPATQYDGPEGQNTGPEVVHNEPTIVTPVLDIDPTKSLQVPNVLIHMPHVEFDRSAEYDKQVIAALEEIAHNSDHYAQISKRLKSNDTLELIHMADQHGIKGNELIYFLAQLMAESGLDPTAIHSGSGTFRARGLIQLDGLGEVQAIDPKTHKTIIRITDTPDVYAHMAKRVAFYFGSEPDLVNHPDLAADPTISKQIAITYWLDKIHGKVSGLNQPYNPAKGQGVVAKITHLITGDSTSRHAERFKANEHKRMNFTQSIFKAIQVATAVARDMTLMKGNPEKLKEDDPFVGPVVDILTAASGAADFLGLIIAGAGMLAAISWPTIVKIVMSIVTFVFSGIVRDKLKDNVKLINKIRKLQGLSEISASTTQAIKEVYDKIINNIKSADNLKRQAKSKSINPERAKAMNQQATAMMKEVAHHLIDIIKLIAGVYPEIGELNIELTNQSKDVNGKIVAEPHLVTENRIYKLNESMQLVSFRKR